MTQKPLSATMRATLEKVVRKDSVAKGRAQPLLDRGLIQDATSPVYQYDLTDAGKEVLGPRLAEIQAEEEQYLAKLSSGPTYEQMREKDREARKNDPPGELASRVRIAAWKVSAQLRRAGWNTRYQGKDRDGVQVRAGFLRDKVIVEFRYHNRPRADMAQMVEDMVKTLLWLGLVPRVVGKVTPSRATIDATALPRVDYHWHTFLDCPICGREQVYVSKIRKGLSVFSNHRTPDESAVCEAVDLTPEQAQLVKEGKAPPPERRVPGEGKGVTE